MDLKFPEHYQLAQINMILDLHDNPAGGIEGCQACWYEVCIEAGREQSIIQDIKLVITWDNGPNALITFLQKQGWERHYRPDKFVYMTSDRVALKPEEITDSVIHLSL